MIPALSGIPSIRDDEFALFQALVRREAGIALGVHKKPLLVSRLSPRLRALGVRSFADYYKLVTEPKGGPELVRMLDCICTNETRFFREPAQFKFLEREVIPAWIQGGPRRIQVWSAACSTGEEPYSAAMTLLHHLPPSDFPIEILASDLSTRVLERAQRAIWPLERAEEIPLDYLHAYMLRGKDAQRGNMKAGPEIRRLVSFRRINLNEDTRLSPGLFDLILCRNVLIYFDAATRASVMSRLLGCLRPRGYLFLGHAESLNGSTDRMQNMIPAVYQLKPRQRALPRSA
jgi:chemotaxis protein methyltransferase CheR